MYYFAYGSNMNFKQMKERCPSSRFITKVYLYGYKFVYDGESKKRKGAVANIIESIGNRVWGGLFEINKDNLAALDCYEGYHIKKYDKKTVEVKDEKGTVYSAIAYYRIGEKVGKPGEEYQETILRGAKDCGLPEEYIKIL